MKQAHFQIVHYVPNLFVGGRVPVAALVHEAEGQQPHIVRAEFHPDERCLGGHGHVVALHHALGRLEREPHRASTAVLGPHLEFDEPRLFPQGVEAVAWLRERVLPRASTAEGSRGPRRATYGYEWLKERGVARMIRKRFRPEKPDAPQVPELIGKKLKSVSHWTTDGERVVLLEPIVPSDLPQGPIEDIATVFGAYRFHLDESRRVTLGAYMLAGGSEAARAFTQATLNASAHRVFDTEHPDQRAELLETIRVIGEHAPLLAQD